MMKFLIASVILTATVLGQTPAKMITFNRTDTEHCRVIVVDGKPLLESTYDGTTVAIAMPVNRGNGEFLVFVAVAQAGAGAVQVNPRDFYGLYSDTEHTRFTFYDKAAEMEWGARGQAGAPGLSAQNAQVDPGSLRPGAIGLGGPPPGNGSPGPGSGTAAGTGAPIPATYLHRSKVKQGNKIAGWVILRQAKGPKLEVHPADMLDEVDIPVNGIVFRF